ncbi:MAG: TonB-dependent receptor [Flavobacterium sp.]|jgi:vitamin B12 transporter|nr:TonB-dependent receptor [Flavobacterium sp.]
MNKQCVIIGALALCLLSTNVLSQEKTTQEKKVEQLEEIVISATKFELKKENTGKVIYKISQKDIQRNAGKSVIELLSNVLGVEIRGVNSNPGEPRSTYIRGGRSRQALVLIDGVPLSDPTGIEQSYDLRLLSLNQIESIEVLKGASSTLYGSGAGTGVINIILKKASENTVSGVYEVSLGTNSTSKNSTSSLNDKNQNISINGTLDKFKYNAFFNITGTSGFSSAKSTLTIPFEEDTYTSNNGFLKLGYEFNTQFRIETFLNFDTFDYTFDAGAFNDSDINLGNQEQFRIGIRPQLKYKKGEVFLNASINSLDRSFESFNSFSGGTNVFVYKGTSVNLDLVNKYEFTKNFQLITGINYQKHENESISDFGNIDPDLANFNVVDPYVSAVYITDFGLSINAGGRLNIHSNYGNNFVYDTNLAFGIVKKEEINLKLISSYSTAFIAPSLYQLFSDYGSTNLAPETNRTFEFGFESKLGQQWGLSAVYYNRVEENKVIFLNLPTPPYGIYANALETIDVSGIEADVTFTISKELTTTVGYAFVDKTSDIDYIPKNKLTASFVANPIKNLAISTMFKNVGERSLFDAFGSFGEAGKDVILPSYSLLDMNVNYKVLEGKVLLFGSITNLLNEDYEETIGFNTRGRNFKMGIRIQF